MTDRPDMTVLDFWDDVLAPEVPLLRRESWVAWRAALRALFALPLEGDELKLYRRCTGRENPPSEPAREGWFVVGRRGGKSYVMSLVASYLATVPRYELAPGERGVLMVLAQDRRQARVVRRYVGSLFDGVPMLAAMVEHETKESVQLNNGIDVEIHTSSFRSVRGYTVVGAICDELAFWRSDDAADPDREVLAALRPAMATTGGMLLAISSPYARKGSLYEAYDRHHGEDSDVMVWAADTLTMNPTVPEGVIAKAFDQDETAAWSEYGRAGEIRFRRDIESYVPLEVVDDATVPGRAELPPQADVAYRGFLDFAGGSGQDSAALAVAHIEERDGERVAVLDAVREVRPPFSPAQVCAEFASLLQRYRLTKARADRFAGDFVTEAMAEHDVRVEPAERVKSDIYKALIPLLNSGQVELLDVPRLRAQVVSLERRVGRSGRDRIDHPSGGRDDVVNAAAGALVLAAQRPAKRLTKATWGRGRQAEKPKPRPGGSRDPNVVARVVVEQGPYGAEVVETEGRVPPEWRKR